VGVSSSECECSNEHGAMDQNGQVPMEFEAKSYLAYQAAKFLQRFDANCYIHLTAKMDSHNVTRGRSLTYPESDSPIPPCNEYLRHVFRNVPARALVISVQTDVLFRLE
jgi:homoserine O-acetyltransferase